MYYRVMFVYPIGQYNIIFRSEEDAIEWFNEQIKSRRDEDLERSYYEEYRRHGSVHIVELKVYNG